MNDVAPYPVPNRSPERNRRIAGHEIGHAFVTRALGNFVHSVTIVPSGGYEGACVRSAAPTQLTFSNDPTTAAREVVSVCERLERLAPELGSGRTADSDLVVRGQSMVIELLAGSACEEILFPDERSLGAKHDHVEAHAIARICVAAQPATKHLIQYCYAEARSLIRGNIDICKMLMAELIEFGTLDSTEIDTIIAAGMTARAIVKERQRRLNWRERERSAAAFLKGMPIGRAFNKTRPISPLTD